MKTLVMNKFTMLMEQLSTGAKTNINKAAERAPTGFNNCSWVCHCCWHTHDKIRSDWGKPTLEMFERCTQLTCAL
jgi:hypothetical protein